MLVEHGKTIDRNLRANRITLEESRRAGSAQQIAHIEDVEWGVLETSGQISFIPKSASCIPACLCT